MTHPCKDCGHQISPRAPTCPNCGRPNTRSDDRIAKIIFGILGGIIAGIIALSLLAR